MDMEQLESEARAKASRHVAALLHSDGKLEKLSQLKFNTERKKASSEAMLKTAMQSQLDGVRTGLAQLERALKDIQEVHTCMEEMEESLEAVPILTERLAETGRLTLKHLQLATARENLKHIFLVPEAVEQTENQITEGRLLEAHKALFELETSRDEVLFELYKLPGHESSPRDQQLLTEYFEPVSKLSSTMEKQLKFIMRRTLNTVRKEPKVVVTALRIVEREERLDEEAMQKQKTTGFMAPGRPKRWRQSCMSVLRTNVQERIEGNQLESRDQDKMWLVRHLELIRLITVEDLRVARTLCQPVFPPHYNIMDHYIQLYREALTNRLLEIISAGLVDQEYVTLLSWVIQVYPGKDLMADPSLRISSSKIVPLLEDKIVQQLQNKYLDNIRENYRNWMRNSLSQEEEDWRRDEEPEVTNDNCYHTSAPIIIYQMIDENLQVAATISDLFVHRVLSLSLQQVEEYAALYATSVREYKNAYFRDRATIKGFTRYMIAIVNNSERFEELTLELRERWWKDTSHHDQSDANSLQKLVTAFHNLREEACSMLLDESFLDIDAHFNDVLTSKWLTTTDAVDTVCATLEDYFADYEYLKPNNKSRVVDMAENRVAKRYIASLLQPSGFRIRKVSLESDTERRNAANKIRNEAEQLKRFFARVSASSSSETSVFEAISMLAEVLSADKEMLALDIGTLLKHFPDLRQEQLLLLLQLRGDLSKTEAKEMAEEYVTAEPNHAVSTIMSEVSLERGVAGVAMNFIKDGRNRFQAARNNDALNPFGPPKEDQGSNPFD